MKIDESIFGLGFFIPANIEKSVSWDIKYRRGKLIKNLIVIRNIVSSNTIL